MSSKTAWISSDLLLATNTIEANTLLISKDNEVYIKIDAEPVIKQELSDYFTFAVPGAKFMPAYRNRMWDGKMRLYNPMTKQLYMGLLPYVQHFANERDYEVEVENNLHILENFSIKEANEFVSTLKTSIIPRDYQLDSFVHLIRHNRSLLVSPTASGKSFIIYLLVQWYGDSKTLIIVPTTSLVYQMKTDFIEYGMNENDIHIIMSGREKNTDCRVVISTWQSLYKLRKDYFSQYEVVVGDECHLFKAKSLTSIMTKLIDCKYRFGFTGTLDGTHTHKLILEGLFGQVKQFVKTKDLIDQNYLAKFKIKCLVLKHTEEEKKLISKANYQDEMDYIVTNPRRNKFIKNLTLSLDGNTLLLFQFVDKHGKILYNNISNKLKVRKVFFVYGGTNAETREQIRAITEKERNAIIIASYGTFSTGINIRNLHNIIFASPSKSRIRNLQSIGRGLRRGDAKEKATLFDISDDLRHKNKVNYTLKHFAERLKIYNEEEFDYKIYNINL